VFQITPEQRHLPVDKRVLEQRDIVLTSGLKKLRSLLTQQSEI